MRVKREDVVLHIKKELGIIHPSLGIASPVAVPIPLLISQPNLPMMVWACLRALMLILIVSSDCAVVGNWKWGGSASPAAVKPAIMVAVKTVLEVLLPVIGRPRS
jgi:hypothetical protein